MVIQKLYSLIFLLTSISNQVRMMYTVNIYERKKYSNDEIAKKLNANPYRIKKIREINSLYSPKEIRELMIKLEEIDLKSKSTDESTNSLIENFIINLKKD